MAKSARVMRERADRAMSDYIRAKYAVDGYVQCVSCDANKPIAEMQNAHWISRGKAGTRFVETNCHPACPQCNGLQKEKHMRVYTLMMLDTYGRDHMDQLEASSREITRHRIADYEQIEAHFKGKLRDL